MDQKQIDELRAGVAEYLRANQPAKPKQPDAPGCENLSEASRATAADLYGAHAMGTPAAALSDRQKDYLRAAIAAYQNDPEGV